MARMHVSNELLEDWNPLMAPWPKGTKIAYVCKGGFPSDFEGTDYSEFEVNHPALKGVDIFSPVFGLEDGHVRFKSWGL